MIGNVYQNPVIPGFHPDPSICRKDNDYYLVTSSFEFFPGVPLFHSEDLVNWKQIGHVLTRRTQLELTGCRTSGGIFAPTIRFHDGRFYMTTTNVDNLGNFYVWTDDIRGEWSDPIRIAQGGIDPSLFFDDDGSVYFTSTFTDRNGPCIGQSRIDIKTGDLLSETKAIWHGTGGKCPEGPHTYKIDGIYYLMIAEGGTEYGHMETIARSSCPWGPYEGCNRNPILSHRDINPLEGVYQALGHGDLIETPEHDWWMVFHGIRPSQFMLHHLGRETMLAPVRWDDKGWPIVNEGRSICASMTAHKVRSSCIGEECKWHNFRDDLNGRPLDPSWSFLRNPIPTDYIHQPGISGLGLKGTEISLDDPASPTFIGRRQQHFAISVEVTMIFDPADSLSRAGLSVFHTNEHHYDLTVMKKDGRKTVFLRKRVADIILEMEHIILPERKDYILKIIASKYEYNFFIGIDGKEWRPVGSGRSQLLSTEVMGHTFTGCFIGLFSQGADTAYFKDFEYRELKE